MSLSTRLASANLLTSCFTLSLFNSLVGFIYVFSIIRICQQELTVVESASFLVLFTFLGLLKNSDLCKADFFFSTILPLRLYNKDFSTTSRQWPLVISLVSHAVRYSYSPQYIYRIASPFLIFVFVLSCSFLFLHSFNSTFSLLATLFIFLYYFAEVLLRLLCLAFEFLLKLKFALAIQIIFRTSLLAISAASIVSGSFHFFICASSVLFAWLITSVFLFLRFYPTEALPIPRVLRDPPHFIKRSHLELFLPILLGFINAQCDSPLALFLLGPNSANQLFFAYTLAKSISVPARSLITPLRANFAHMLYESGSSVALVFLQANMLKSVIPSLFLFACSCSLVYLTPLSGFLSPPAFVLTLLIAFSELIAGIFYPAIDCIIFAGSFYISRFLLLGPIVNLSFSVPLALVFGVNGIAFATVVSVCIVSVSVYLLGARSLSHVPSRDLKP